MRMRVANGLVRGWGAGGARVVVGGALVVVGGARVVRGWCAGGARVVRGWCAGGTTGKRGAGGRASMGGTDKDGQR